MRTTRDPTTGHRERERSPGPGLRARLWLIPLLLASTLAACGDSGTGPGGGDEPPLDPELVAQGKDVFRFDTFGDDVFWTDTARLHEVIESAVSPALALQVGLKVDADALPQSVKDAIAAGQVDLQDPATTLALLKLNAVLGVQGTVETVNGRDTLTRVGITCALCHSTVDNSFAPGIGRRLDGWPNGDLDVGAIVALSPAIPPALKEIMRGWGPGMYDPRINIDGKNTPIVIAPAYGLRGVSLETFTGEGPVSYWNAYVAVTQMHGQGNFTDPRLGISVVHAPDQVTPVLAALREYQLSLMVPEPPPGSFDATSAARGKQLFSGKARCSSCHFPDDHFTDVNSGRLHDAAETGMDAAYAERTATGRYRTTPLRGLWQHAPYFHDGSAATLADVVSHYDGVLSLGLTEQERHDLVEYLKTL
ncbi:MAG TPA: c-type cytochrome [Longimicrobiaceae bacterium]|nr:c-type cytochrome [Longimicrobiaceae bacterium]